MALPTLAKSWTWDRNVAVTSDERNIQRVLKDRLKLLNWTLVGSCDSVAAGMDGVDRWDSDTDVVFNATDGQPRSWIVMEQPGTGAQYCLWFNRGNAFWPDRIFSAGGLFTGGTTTARPTATDEIVFNTGVSMMHDTSSTQRLHILQSSDGKNTHVFLTGPIDTIFGTKNLATMTLLIGELGDKEPGLSHPYYFYSAIDGTTLNWGAKVMYDTDRFCAYDTTMGARNDIGVGVERVITIAGDDWVSSVRPDEVSGEWGLQPVSIIRNASGAPGVPGGRYGTIPDFYFSARDPINDSPTGLLPGTGLPADGSRQFMVFGGYVVPWGGGAVPLFS